MSLPTIENAFENIKAACQNRLATIYPKGIPDDIYSRYLQELSFLEQSSLIDDFEIFRCLSLEARKSSTVISMRGTVTGSILYFLLGNNCFNPLPPYYYCPECGYYEKIHTSLFGIDLPLKNCPKCNTTIMGNGFHLPIESVWGNDGKKIVPFDYNVNSEFLPFARRVLQTLYPNNSVVPWGMFRLDPAAAASYPDDRIIGIELSGYAILPAGNTIQDYPELVSYLEDGDACVTGGGWELEEHLLKPIRLLSLEYLDELIQLQRATGIYTSDLTCKELRDITWSNICNTAIPNSSTRMLFHEFKPKTFKDMVSLDSSSHNSFSWQEANVRGIDLYEFKKMMATDSFKKYPCYTQEDFFDHLLELGIDRKIAFDTSERIRKGHANSVGKYKEEFFELPVPNEIKEVARNYRYLFSRAHCVEYMLIYAKLAYYAKIDSRAFSKIVHSQGNIHRGQTR